MMLTTVIRRDENDVVAVCEVGERNLAAFTAGAPTEVNTTIGTATLSLTRPRVAFIKGASMGAATLRQTAKPVLLAASGPPSHHQTRRLHGPRVSKSTRGIPLMLSPDRIG